jgi:hypothetical protein
MKKCGHCGCENPDDAVQCSNCGKPTLTTGDSPVNKTNGKEGRLSFQKSLLLRLGIAACVCLLISGISIYVAWQQTNRSEAWYPHELTERTLYWLGKTIDSYQNKFHAAPTSFKQLQLMTNEVSEMECSVTHWTVDGWQHPLVFQINGANSMVVSYGADGKAGGEGINYDLTSENPYSSKSQPTFAQFWGNPACAEIIRWCFYCGGMAAFLSILTVRIPNLSRRGAIILIVSLGATLMGTLFITTVITALHVPSGH